MGRILLLSNGHGEDLSGSLLGSALRTLGHEVTALPLAGLGNPYAQATIPLPVSYTHLTLPTKA